MSTTRARRVIPVALAGALVALSAPPAGAEPLGSVTSLSGEAFAEGPQGRRGLACNGELREGERLITGEGARVGLMARDVYVELEGPADVALGATAEGAPSVRFASGRGRVVDARDAGGPALEIHTPHARARGTETDTEVQVGEGRTRICQDGGRAEVRIGGPPDPIVARAGRCVTLTSQGVASLAGRSDDEIRLAGGDGCIDVAVASHFLPEVAAGPERIGLAPFDPDRLILGPCDDPGSGCSASLAPPGGDIFEQPPEPPSGCFPGNPAGCVD